MPLNIPGGNKQNLSMGPGVIFMGAAGTTPSITCGYISEDGIKITLESEMLDLKQGNPQTLEKRVSTAHGVKLEFTTVEWEFTQLNYAIGAGNTTSGASSKTFAFGGDPLVEEVAIHVQHKMAIPGHTMNAHIWTGVSDGDVEVQLGKEWHAFPQTFSAQRTSTNWAGGTLPFDEQLIQFLRQTA